MLERWLTCDGNGAMGMRGFMHAHDEARLVPIQTGADVRDEMLENGHGNKL